MAKKIPIPVLHYTTPKEIKQQNDYLEKCANNGKLFFVRERKIQGGSKDVYFANYDNNSMYIMSLNRKGFIKKFTRW